MTEDNHKVNGMQSYADLKAENEWLRAENARLTALLEQNEIEVPKPVLQVNAKPDANSSQRASVTKRSSAAEKIALFRSFFRGREDVFARRWYSKTTEKSGY